MNLNSHIKYLTIKRKCVLIGEVSMLAWLASWLGKVAKPVTLY